MLLTHEEVVGIWAFASDFKELYEVPKLAMYVSADGDWCVYMLDIGLFDEDLSRL